MKFVIITLTFFLNDNNVYNIKSKEKYIVYKITAKNVFNIQLKRFKITPMKKKRTKRKNVAYIWAKWQKIYFK